MQDYIEDNVKSIGHDDNNRSSRIGKPDAICYTTSVVIPIICIFGVIGNVVCVTVMTKYEKRSSYYTYLIVLSCSDLGNCILLLMSTVSRGIENQPSNFYDLISIPLGCTFSGISVSATSSVTLDRLCLLWKPTRLTPPSVCTKIFARRIMLLSVLTSIVLNLPYYFVFYLDENGRIVPTQFYHTQFYYVYNWFRFFIYGIIPSIFLTICTILLIISLKRVKIQLRHLSLKRKTDKDSSMMTISLIFILVFFLIGEVPGHFLSKKAAALMLFGGDESLEFEKTFQVCRKVASVLAALNISINFLLYFALHPPFRNGVRELLFGAKNETSNDPSKKTTETNDESNDVKIDIFVVGKNGGGNMEKKIKIVDKLTAWMNPWWNALTA